MDYCDTRVNEKIENIDHYLFMFGIHRTKIHLTESTYLRMHFLGNEIIFDGKNLMGYNNNYYNIEKTKRVCI